MARWAFDVTLPPDADLSRLYYLRQPRDGYFYRWPKDRPDLWGLPRDPPPVHATFDFEVTSATGPVAVEHDVPWEFVGVNPARGEFHRPVLTVPTISAAVTPSSLAWPLARRGARTLTVAVRSEGKDGSSGTVTLSAPAGWTVTPGSYDFSVDAEGAERSFAFQVQPTESIQPGEATFHAAVTAADGHRYDEGFSIIDYPHIERAALFSPATATITVIPVRIADGLKVGYIMGTGDDGPEALRQMGADVTLLGRCRQ